MNSIWANTLSLRAGRLLARMTLLGLIFFLFANQAWAYCRDGCSCCQCPSGPAQCREGYPSCEAACGMTPQGGGSSSFDFEAARQAQEAARRAEEAKRRAEQQRQEEALRKAREEAARQEKFLQDRDAAAATLKGSTGAVVGTLKGAGAASNVSGLKGGFDSATTGLKQGTDASVVDARQVPSGLPQGVDKAIAAVYADAAPGVEGRVRKGFQAVMVHDWAVAKAWFEDALHHDPQNANLQRLVQLTDDPRQHAAPPGAQGSGKGAPAPAVSVAPLDPELEKLFDEIFRALEAVDNDRPMLKIINQQPAPLTSPGAETNPIHN